MRPRPSPGLFLIVALLLLLSTFAWGRPAATEPKASATPKYVGSEVCMSCHEDLYKSFAKTAHYKLITGKLKPAETGCEACHGPGEDHVNAGGDKMKIRRFSEMKPRAINETCLGCHKRDQVRTNFLRSEHNVNDVGCASCHDPHHAKVTENLLRQPQSRLCYECHGEIRTEFAMPFHHRVPEGLMNCTDCHSQYGCEVGFAGAKPSRLMRTSVGTDEVCFRCHADKRGPFAFEHQPVKIEGCQICHQPHGASNSRMLTRSDVRFLCLECHTNTSAIPIPGTPVFHDQSTPRFQNCTTCHVMIHGSNSSAVFFR